MLNEELLLKLSTLSMLMVERAMNLSINRLEFRDAVCTSVKYEKQSDCTEFKVYIDGIYNEGKNFASCHIMKMHNTSGWFFDYFSVNCPLISYVVIKKLVFYKDAAGLAGFELANTHLADLFSAVKSLESSGRTFIQPYDLAMFKDGVGKPLILFSSDEPVGEIDCGVDIPWPVAQDFLIH